MANMNVTYGEMTSRADQLIAGRDEIEPLIDVNRQVLEGLQSFPG